MSKQWRLAVLVAVILAALAGGASSLHRAAQGEAVTAPATAADDDAAVAKLQNEYSPKYAAAPVETPKKAAKLMAVYQVSSAGQGAANGSYTPTGSTYGGKPTYSNGSWVLYYGLAGGMPSWNLSPSIPAGGEADYYCASGAPATPDAGTWNSLNVGDAAPSVEIGFVFDISLTGTVRNYPTPPNTWVVLADSLSVSGSAHKDDSSATGISSVEYSIDSRAAFATSTVSPSATTITLSAERTIAELAVQAGTPGSHTLKVTLKDAGGTVKAVGTVAFTTVARIAEVQAYDVSATVAPGSGGYTTNVTCRYKSWYGTDAALDVWSGGIGPGNLGVARTDIGAQNDSEASGWVDITLDIVFIWEDGTYDYTVNIGTGLGTTTPTILATSVGHVNISVSGDPPGPPPGPPDPGGGDVTPPTVAITSPADASVIAGAFSVLATAADEEGGSGLARVECYIDGVLKDTLTAANYSGGTVFRFPDATNDYTTATLTPGNHTITVFAFDNAGNSASATVVITQPADVVPPVVSIIRPVTGASVGGSVTVDVRAIDDNGVARVRLAVGNIQQGTDLFLSNASDATGPLYRWTVDFGNWSNGSYVIQAWAWDNAGNRGSGAITVTVANDLASSSVLRVLGPSTLARRLLADDQLYLTYRAGAVPSDPRYAYNVFAGILYADAPSANWADYAPVPIRGKFVASQTPYYIGLYYQPRVVESYWDSGAASIARVQTLSDGSRYCLFAGPASIQRFATASGFTQVADLSAYSPTDMKVVLGAAFCALGDHIKAFDLTTGAPTYTVSELAGDAITSIDCLATDGTYLFVAATITGGHALYSITSGGSTGFLSVVKLTALPVAATCLFAEGGAVFLGDAAGNVRTWSGTALALDYASGEDHIAGFGFANGYVYAGTGNLGRIYRRLDVASWEMATDLPITNADAVAVFGGYLHAGGDSANLYRENSDLSWSQPYTLDLTAAVNWMDTDTVGGAEALLVATSATEGHTARLYRLQVAGASAYTVPAPIDAVAWELVPEGNLAG